MQYISCHTVTNTQIESEGLFLACNEAGLQTKYGFSRMQKSNVLGENSSLDQPFSILFQLQLLAFQYLQHLAFIFGIAPPFFICFYFSSFYLLLIDFA